MERTVQTGILSELNFPVSRIFFGTAIPPV